MRVALSNETNKVARDCQGSFNPDWLMKTYYKAGRFRKPWLTHENLLTVQNKSGQISKAYICLAIAVLGYNSFDLVVWKILLPVYQHGFRYRC